MGAMQSEVVIVTSSGIASKVYSDAFAGHRYKINSPLEFDGRRIAPGTSVLVDIRLDRHEDLSLIKVKIAAARHLGDVVLVVDKNELPSEAQLALRPAKIVRKPFVPATLRQHVFGVDQPSNHRGTDSETSIANAAASLENTFEGLMSSRRVDEAALNMAGDELVWAIANDGIERFMKMVREHHAGTYQHCLLVTGIVASFAGELGFSTTDRRSMAVTGLVHDVGKAKIPPEILDKPGRLSEDEFRIMKYHSRYGYHYLQKHSDLPDAILQATRSHHEYLDGSGYPDRLQGQDIGDVTRILTVADIFGALMEARAYKLPMSNVEAYAVLRDMAEMGKLEPGLVRAFEPIARVIC